MQSTQVYLYALMKCAWVNVQQAWIPGTLWNGHYFKTCVQTLAEWASPRSVVVAVQKNYILLMARYSLEWMLAAKAVLQAPRLHSWCSCDTTVTGAGKEKRLQEALLQRPRCQVYSIHPAAPFPRKMNSVEKNSKYIQNPSNSQEKTINLYTRFKTMPYKLKGTLTKLFNLNRSGFSVSLLWMVHTWTVSTTTSKSYLLDDYVPTPLLMQICTITLIRLARQPTRS